MTTMGRYSEEELRVREVWWMKLGGGSDSPAMDIAMVSHFQVNKNGFSELIKVHLPNKASSLGSPSHISSAMQSELSTPQPISAAPQSLSSMARQYECRPFIRSSRQTKA